MRTCIGQAPSVWAPWTSKATRYTATTGQTDGKCNQVQCLLAWGCSPAPSADCFVPYSDSSSPAAHIFMCCPAWWPCLAYSSRGVPSATSIFFFFSLFLIIYTLFYKGCCKSTSVSSNKISKCWQICCTSGWYEMFPDNSEHLLHLNGVRHHSTGDAHWVHETAQDYNQTSQRKRHCKQSMAGLWFCIPFSWLWPIKIVICLFLKKKKWHLFQVQ